MRATRIFETILYVNDLDAAAEFYVGALGLERIGQSGLMLSLRCGDSALLIFDPSQSVTPGRDVPSHGCQGAGHIAFAATKTELDEWRQQLARHHIEIEQEVQWEAGGRSIYVRDPAGNSVEFAPSTLWGGGWGF